jgi:wyosine [tRNA(Phe)-imidazoG37] synthetase (radical SAM superfamily)
MKTNYKYLFGPVPSRRLGRSLGIDVTPFKTCSFDCLFCQCGATTESTTQRKEFVPFKEVCSELELWLEQDGQADVITFAGSGEPTLYSRLGDLIDFIQSKTDIPVIVLTNGTLLYREEVRAETAKADQVKISLSAWDEASFQKVNQPADGLSFHLLCEGEHLFREQFTGPLSLEVFLMDGINSAPDEVQQIAEIAKTIRPDQVHLNTAVRPPADASVRAVPKEQLEQLCSLFTPPAEIIASFKETPEAEQKTREVHAEELCALIRRHPATAAQLASATGSRATAVEEILTPLVDSGELKTEMRNGETYYK